MHKNFYASGFLYHQPTRQILLQKPTPDGGLTLFIGSGNHPEDDPRVVFHECIKKATGVAVDLSLVHPVYDYINGENKEQFVYFLNLENLPPEKFSAEKGLEWVPVLKLSKTKMDRQTRHDIMIGERVIRSLLENNPTGSGV